MSFKGKKVLVTGGMGFIGSHLSERLVREGAQVRVLGRYNSRGQLGWLEESELLSEMECILGDVRDPECVAAACRGVETVFHLAALIGIPYSYVAPYSYTQTNIEGTLNVLQAVRTQGVERMVHTSTSEVYGSALQVPIREDHPLQGQSPYSATKIGADKLVESYFLSFNTPVVTARPFNTFGPRQSTRAVIPTIISQALARQPVRLGSLAPTRDFNFVTNTVEGFLAAGSSPKALGQTYNLGYGKEVSVGDLAKLIFELVGTNAEIICEEARKRPIGSEVTRLLADNSKASQELDWTPKVGLREGLQVTINWMHNRSDYSRQVYAI